MGSEGTHEYGITPQRKVRLPYDDVLTALGKLQAECDTEGERYVRDCFDWFFYYVDRIEHYIQTGLIEYGDVSPVFKPYLGKVADPVLRAFMASRGYELAPKFWDRFGTAPNVGVRTG